MRALSTAATGMIAQQDNLDVIANNLANVNTTGFKSQRAEFQDLMYQTMSAAIAGGGAGQAERPTAIQIGLGSAFVANATDFSEGSIQTTGNPLDLAISGPGFFRVLQPDGTVAYTRDGSFSVDGNGLLVNDQGYPLDPPITVPSGANSISISTQGQVSASLPTAPGDQTSLGAPIQVTLFQNPAGMLRIGQNLYLPSQASGQPQVNTPGQNGAGTVTSGALEGSNVQVVQEMVQMITAQRAYEINSKAIQTSDQMLQTINNLNG